MIYAVIERGPEAGTASSFETWDQYDTAHQIAQYQQFTIRSGYLYERTA